MDEKHEHESTLLRVIRIPNFHLANVFLSNKSVPILRDVVKAYGTAAAVNGKDLVKKVADV